MKGNGKGKKKKSVTIRRGKDYSKVAKMVKRDNKKSSRKAGKAAKLVSKSMTVKSPTRAKKLHSRAVKKMTKK